MFRNTSCWIVLMLAAWAALLDAPAARGEDRYYMMIFAFEGRPNLPRSAHTFATFIRRQETQNLDPRKWPMESHTISWVSPTMNGQILLRPPEKGVNLDLAASLKLAGSLGAQTIPDQEGTLRSGACPDQTSKLRGSPLQGTGSPVSTECGYQLLPRHQRHRRWTAARHRNCVWRVR
jgi:hypothetical protein